MLFIFGWLRRFTILGLKIDECASCGQVCQHVVGRKTNWGHLFWIPVLFLGFEHGMICTTCKTWTPIPWGQVRAAMKSGVLHLERPRPNAPALLAAASADSDGLPPHPAVAFDSFLINPKRGPWDLYLKAWPVLVALVLAAGALAPHSSATTSGTTTTSGGTTTSVYGAPHTCWEGSDGSIVGCRLSSGTIEGSTSGSVTTCYFYEPLPAGNTTLRCDR